MATVSARPRDYDLAGALLRLYPQKNFATLARAIARVKDTIPQT